MNLRKRLENPPDFHLTEALFLRLLGFVYLSSFASFLPQVKGLLGSSGIAPLGESLTALRFSFGMKAFFYVPTLFWFDSGNAALIGLCLAGCAASMFLLSGVFSRYAAAVCFVLYLSLTSAGSPFTNFQWDALLLECGFLALFTGASWLIWAYRLLLFRLMFESGLVKVLSNDLNWRNFHALRFHFMTQPLPTPVAYYVYRLPAKLLDLFTLLTLAIEIIGPFFIFSTKKGRYIAGALFISLQILILLTGNYAFFNLLTLCLCLWCFDDENYAPIERLLSRTYPKRNDLSVHVGKFCNIALMLLMAFGLLQLASMLMPIGQRLLQPLEAVVEPFEIVNSYGLFAVMTTTRPEIVLEGSNDGQTWREYSFRYKPGNTHRGLPMVAPYQPRLDWQMWFAALGPYRQNAWVGSLMYRLLTNELAVLALIEPPPFPAPPRYLRAELFDYSFTTPATRRRTGEVWLRKSLGIWVGPVSLTKKE